MAKAKKPPSPEKRIDNAIRNVEAQLSKLKVAKRFVFPVSEDLDGRPIWLTISQFGRLQIVYERPQVTTPSQRPSFRDLFRFDSTTDEKPSTPEPIDLQRAELPLKMVIASMLPDVLAAAMQSESQFDEHLRRVADELDAAL